MGNACSSKGTGTASACPDSAQQSGVAGDRNGDREAAPEVEDRSDDYPEVVVVGTTSPPPPGITTRRRSSFNAPSHLQSTTPQPSSGEANPLHPSVHLEAVRRSSTGSLHLDAGALLPSPMQSHHSQSPLPPHWHPTSFPDQVQLSLSTFATSDMSSADIAPISVCTGSSSHGTAGKQTPQPSEGRMKERDGSHEDFATLLLAHKGGDDDGPPSSLLDAGDTSSAVLSVSSLHDTRAMGEPSDTEGGSARCAHLLRRSRDTESWVEQHLLAPCPSPPCLPSGPTSAPLS